MPPSSIASTKELAATFKPMVLATITFPDGTTVRRFATAGLNTTEGGYPYGGNNYSGRLLEYQLGPLQGYDDMGIDLISRVTLSLADPDKALKTLYEDVYGFAGATLDLRFVFWEADSANYSSDSRQVFRGICDAPRVEHDRLILEATNKLNLQRRRIPNVLVQRRCPWINPTTVAQRATANNEDSAFWECGETRDLTTAPPCEYTKATCTQPLRFGGMAWDVGLTGRSREYTSGNWIDISNQPNDASWGQAVPMVYGTAWVSPKVRNIWGDGNSTRGEAIVCLGEVNSIQKVVVNDVELQPATDITGGVNYIVADALLRYNVINRGDRDGSPNADVPYNGQGDPYGSMCAILWVVPRRVAESSSTPRVRALVQGPKIRVYTDASTYSKAYTANPIWILLDLLIWAGLDYADVDLGTFVAAAAICDQTIPYTDQWGNASTHARYSCSLVIDSQRSAAEVIRGVRMACGAILVANGSSGKLEVYLEGTLASQQPAAIAGSNYNVAAASKLLNGTTANGYYAYKFDRVLRDGGKHSLVIEPKPLSSSPNRIQFGFANSEREYASDSIALLDPVAIYRSGQEVPEQYGVQGVNTLDQAKRIAKRRLARTLYGNARGDAGGTEVYSWADSVRAVHLRVGMICLLSDVQNGLNNVPVRILQLRPSSDWETVKIVAERHNDAWYLDTYGQAADPEALDRRRDRLARPAYPWAPAMVAPDVADPMFSETDKTFALEETHEVLADGAVVTRLQVRGYQPVNLPSALAPPQLRRQGTTATSGGNFAGGGRAFYIGIVGKGSDGVQSAPSNLCEVVIVSGGSTNTITAAVDGWDPDTVTYEVYVGASPQLLTLHSTGSGTPASVTVTAWLERDLGMPDIEMDRVLARVKKVVHAGVFGTAATGIGAGTITVAAAGWTAGEWVGYDLSVLGIRAGGEMGQLNFRVTANTTDTLTVTPDPEDLGVAVQDVMVMRSKPTVGSDGGGNYLEDARWENSIDGGGAGLPDDSLVGRLLRIISGPGRGDVYRIKANTATRIYIEGAWLRTPTSASRYIVEELDWLVSQESDSIDNVDPAAELKIGIEVSNYLLQILLVQIYLVDGGGNASLDSLSPIREIYVFGQSGSIERLSGVIAYA